MEVKLLKDGDSGKWDEYVHSHAEGSFFHRAAWRKVIERAFGHKTYFMYVENEGRIVGVLPLAHVKSMIFGNSLSSLPFCVYGGPLSDNDSVQDALLDAAVEKGRALAVDSLELRNRRETGIDWPEKSLYVTFAKEISADEDENLKAIPRKQRAMVRKGIAAGLHAEVDDGVDRFYEAYSRSVHALGTPVFSKKYFTVLTEEFGSDCEVLTITKDGGLVSSVLSFYYKDQVLPYYGGGTSLARSVKGNDFMYWELMRRAGQRGIKVFDYGRSKVGTGSYSFKKNWGFEPEPLHYQYCLIKAKDVPDLNPLNPKYQLFIKMWKKMPYAMTKVIGPHLVKYLG